MAIFFAMPGNEDLASNLADLTSGEVGELVSKRFPDGESYVRILSDVKGRDVHVVCTLARPDPQFLGLAFAANEIRSRGARRVELIAPYLAYMRQDRIFQPGEALTSRLFAQLLQKHFDGLVTVDPHLHRYSSLDEVYDIRTTIVHSASLLAKWISDHLERPIVIGPDCESATFAEAIARQAGSAWTVFKKERRGDRSIAMSPSDLDKFVGCTPVLVDDIVSSGVTMRRAIRILHETGFDPPYCLAVHALCAARTARQIRDSSMGLLSCNTVPVRGAQFDVAPLIADALISAASVSAAVKAQTCSR